MKLRQIRLLLWTASMVLLLLALLVCAWGVMPPVIAEQAPKAKARISTGGKDVSPIPPLTSFAPLLTLDLRQNLGGERVTQVPLAVKLTGTIMEPGRNIAMFQAPDGSVELKAVGESAGGAQVLEIHDDSAVVLYQGQKVTLRIEGRP